LSADDLVRAVGESFGEMAKKLGAETLREIAEKRSSQARKERAEIFRLRALLKKAYADCNNGDVEEAVERLFSELGSWDDNDWEGADTIHELRESIATTIRVLVGIKDEDEGEDEDS